MPNNADILAKPKLIWGIPTVGMIEIAMEPESQMNVWFEAQTALPDRCRLEFSAHYYNGRSERGTLIDMFRESIF